VAIGPDGMIWVVDMYRAVIEHPEWIPQAWQQQIDLRAGSDRGRIYRIVPTNSGDLSPLPNLAQKTAAELVAMLASENGTLRDMAQQELLQRGDKGVVGALRALAASNASPQARVHALWTLHGFGELQDAEVLAALRDEHSGVVRNAILLAEPRIAKNDPLLNALAALVDHADSKVKLQLALVLGESTTPAAGAALARLAPHAARDSWLAQAIVCSSKQHSMAVLEQVLAYLQRSTADADESARLVSMIAALVATAEAAGANPSPLVARAIGVAPADAAWVFPLAAASAKSADGSKKLEAGVRQSILAVYERARSLVADEATPTAIRCQAIGLFGGALGAADEERSILVDLLSPSTPLEVQLAAVARLAGFRDRRSVAQLLSRWSELSHSVREAVALQLVSSAESTEALVAALESSTVLVGDLSPSVRQTLRQASSQSLQARVNRLLGKTTAANQDVIQRYLQFQQNRSQADLARGRELFRKHCAACHVPDASGRATGPDLTNLTDRSPAALTESILAPNRSVEPQFRGYIVVLSDGRVLTGTIAEEAGASITLAQADGKRAVVNRADIDELRNTGLSLMPEGYQQELDPAMLRDLVEFLRNDDFAGSLTSP
jgi:putative heme-binding domain-containing protein